LIKDKGKKDFLDDLARQVTDGASFFDLARKHSECPSAKSGGELGWLSPGSYFPEFEEAAFKAQVGQFVNAETPVGLHLIHVKKERSLPDVQQMSAEELAELLQNPGLWEDVQFVDVREDWEFATAKLPHFKLYPLSRFSEWGSTISQELEPSKETVVLCHHGVRSMQMSTYLVSECGFTDVKNVTGGIDAYSLRADSSVPRY